MSFIISLLKTRDLLLIRKKLITIYILNVTDVIFTIFLINTGMFLETNAFMAPFINNRQLLSIIIKIVIPLVLLFWVYQRMRKATEKQLYQSNILINVCLVFYGFVNVSHIIWTILYYVMKV
ncbi:MAG TPA: DUF5658 family protein [Clostridium sp.]|uniref:DUF5658 family protein n=1 Tax=Clostridium sp. TaxID=1506 RepID=UPI002F92C907